MAKKKKEARKKEHVSLPKIPKKRPAKKKPAADEGVHRTRVRLVAIGGGGGNIVSEIARSLHRADFVAANTDMQAQKTLARSVKGFVFGQELTHGLGCGMDADLGEKAARAEKERIKKLFEGQDITIFVASLGGGTGSGAAPVFAETAREAKSLTLGIFTLPFSFEGTRRIQIAKNALEKIKHFVNAYVVIPNENIFQIIEKDTPLKQALGAVNKRLAETLEGFIETIALPGLINIDFADVKSLLEGRGRLTYLNSAKSQGPAKAQQVFKDVLANPLTSYGIGGVDRILFNIAGDRNLKMQEVGEISTSISSYNQKAKIIFGISLQPKLRGAIRITLFAVGCKLEGKNLPGGRRKQKPRFSLKRQKALEKETEKKKPVSAKSAGKQGSSKNGASKKEPEEAKTESKESPSLELPQPQKKEPPKVRRSALELKKAVDQEMQELEKKEGEWDTPAFLRGKPLP